MKRYSIILLFALGGCTSQSSRLDKNAAWQFAVKHLGAEAKIAGPFSEKTTKELEFLSPQDRNTALGLLDRGALGFLVFTPDYNTTFHTKDAVTANSIKVAKIVFAAGSTIVGDFSVQDNAPHPPPAPAASGSRGSS